MDKEKLKLIVRNLELLVDSLKVEIYSGNDTHAINYDEIVQHINDYDEVFYEEYDNE